MRVLPAIVLLLVLAPSAFAGERADLRAAQTRWAAAGLKDYRYGVQRSCFCPEPYRSRHVVRIRNGKAVHPAKAVRDLSTVPRLFRVIRKLLDGKGTVEVTYGKTGIPVMIAADPIPMAVDDEYTITTDGLRALP